MKTTILATSLLGLSLIACSGEADIGVDTTPITCQPTAVAEMHGSAEYNGETYDFNNASPTVIRDQTGAISMLSLWSSEDPVNQRGNYLRFYFGCGSAEVASYDVVNGTRQAPLACPYEVSASVLGQIEILPATDGVLIVDDNTSCFAGRFRVDLDSELGSGAASGWFSIPLQ
jgi:hypothetical protein